MFCAMLLVVFPFYAFHSIETIQRLLTRLSSDMRSIFPVNLNLLSATILEVTAYVLGLVLLHSLYDQFRLFFGK